MTSIFQRGMMDIIGDIIGDLDWVASYVDDIVIVPDTAEEHLLHFQAVFKRLTKYNLIVNPEKCHFFCTKLILLGLIVNKHGRRINSEKVAYVHTWTEPTNANCKKGYHPLSYSRLLSW